MAILDLRDQVGGSDVQEVPGSKRDKEDNVKLHGGEVCDDASSQESESGKKIEWQSAAFSPAAMHQDAEVAKLLRQFVRGSDQPGSQAQRYAE